MRTITFTVGKTSTATRRNLLLEKRRKEGIPIQYTVYKVEGDTDYIQYKVNRISVIRKISVIILEVIGSLEDLIVVCVVEKSQTFFSVIVKPGCAIVKVKEIHFPLNK